MIISSAAKSLSHAGNQMEANFSQSTVFDATRDSETEIDARADTCADGCDKYRDQCEFGDAGRRREGIGGHPPTN